MPLHLLSKKSWNVYNGDNVERVRRDEAEAQAREEAAEQRMQEEDTQRRIAFLRGEKVDALPETPETAQVAEERGPRRSAHEDHTYSQRDRKRRRRRGEDDTDRDIRYAQQDAQAGREAAQLLMKGSEKDAPLQDHAGHIQLFAAPDEKAIRATQKNEEAEAEKAKKRKREEDQVTMRFSNAAGYQVGLQKPWYADASIKERVPPTASRNELMLAELRGKDVWGNEDGRRKERERSRMASSDPFAAMQQAQRQLKQSEKDKETWQRKQQAELDELKRQQNEQKTSRDVKRRHSWDDFQLDGRGARGTSDPPRQGGGPSEENEHGGRRHRNRHRRHRSRDGSHERDKRGRHRPQRHE